MEDTELVYVAYGIKEPSVHESGEDVGVAIPAAMAFIGMVFVCCVLLVSGLPPLPGLSPFALISTAVHSGAGDAPSIHMGVLRGDRALGLASVLPQPDRHAAVLEHFCAHHTALALEAMPVAATILICRVDGRG